MPAPSARIRVLVVERHAAVRRGVRDLLASYGDIEVVAEAQDGRSALRAAACQSPDVILLDWYLPGQTGPALAPRLCRAAPSAHLLLLGSDEDDLWGEAGVMAAHGYLSKSAVERLGEAIRAVHRGERYR
jgi:two-component system response regulator DesR